MKTSLKQTSIKVDEQAWCQFKSVAAASGRNIQECLAEAINLWVAKKKVSFAS